MSTLASSASNFLIRARAATLTCAVALVMALPAVGCGGLAFGPTYPVDEVDRFHGMARDIQADAASVASTLSDLRERLQAIAKDNPAGAVREVALMVKEIRGVGQRLSGAVGKAAQLIKSGEKIVKVAPQQYGGLKAIHLPRKLELLGEAMGWLAELPEQGTSLVSQAGALAVCATDLLDGATAPRCEGDGLKDVAVAVPPPAQAVAAATDEDEEQPQYEKIQYLAVPAGETVSFAGLIRDEYGNPVSVPIAWEVVAGGGTIDDEGRFTASVVAGRYAETVRATAAGMEAFYSVRVTPGPPTAVTYISPTDTELKPGQKIEFSTEVTDAHGNVTGDKVTWNVRGGAGSIEAGKDEPNKALFVAGGSPGEFEKAVIASFGDAVSTANISIVVGPVARIDVTPSTTKVPVNGARRFTAVPFDADGNIVAEEVTWSVTPSSKARISDRGMLMVGCDVAVGDYPGLVVAMSGGVVKPVDVSILPGRAVSISLSETEMELPTSGQLKLEATAVDACGNEPLAPISWSLPIGGGTISQDGEFRASNRTGTYPIVARSGRVAAQAQVTVEPGEAASIVIAAEDVILDDDAMEEVKEQEKEAEADKEDVVVREDGEGLPVSETRDAETPAEALTKAPPPKAKTGPFLNFVGGVSQAMKPTDDLYEPLPMGTAADFLRRGYEIYHEDRVEFFVDREGQIYKDRIYQGVIPGRRLNADGSPTLEARDVNTVTWVGYQPMAAMSRLFWQLSNAEPSFEVRRIEPTRIEVILHDTVAANENALREMVMELFTGAIRSVRGYRMGSSLKYVIHLKHSAHYLYRYEAPYLYLDFEVDADY